MKKIILSVLIALILVGCSAGNTAGKVVEGFTKTLTEAKLVEVHAELDPSNTVREIEALELPEGNTFAADFAALLPTVKLTSIKTAEVNETNLLYIVKEPETKSVFYIYSDQKVRLVIDNKPVAFSISEEDATKLNDLFKPYLPK